MSYRARHRKRGRAALLGPPVVIAAASLSVGASQGPSAHAPSPAADVQQVEPAGPLQPFAAVPVIVPLDATVASASTTHRKKPRHPAASAPIVTLPTHLNVSASAIPRRVLASYVNATKLEDASDRQCHLQWQTLAGIGFIESGHARSGGSTNPRWDGVAFPPILGPVLDGQDGVGQVPDTDGGVLDGNPTWDRAVGPMQFIPSTWARYASDGNHDGVENPQDIDDATLAAARYLCATGSDLNHPKPLIRAVYAYNHSYIYVRDVLTVEAHYMDIDPAKLGINGLPHRHKHKPRVTITLPLIPLPTPTPTPTRSSSPSPTPTPSSPDSPTPTPTTPSDSPTPTPTVTPTGAHIPRH